MLKALNNIEVQVSNIKVAKKGEFLVKEGDKISSLILIQTGGVSLCLNRNKKNIDIFPLGSSQVLGELGLLGGGSHAFSVYATTETKFMEFPLEAAKTQIEASGQFLKLLLKSLLERVKVATNEVKSQKMEKDSSPAPEDQIAKIFGSIYHTASHKGKKEDEKDPSKITVEWTQMKQYAQRIFGESPRRLEQAVTLLVKIKMAAFVMGKPVDDPEGADEIHRVIIHDLGAVEAFFEFYQYHYFKGGKSEVLKVDEGCFNILEHFLVLAEGLAPDRFGVVTMDYSKILEAFKEDLNLNLGSGHFTLLENRGIFGKRQPRQDGSVAYSFELKEWATTLKIWKIMREIEKWNEKGFVDLNEDLSKKAKKSTGNACPQCQAELPAQAKFCSECGAKINSSGNAGSGPSQDAA